MRVTRRSLIKSGSLAAAGAVAARASAGDTPVALLIYDSRQPASARFACGVSVGTRIDVAQQHDAAWQHLRKGLPQGRVIALTRWTDHVMARGYLEEQGRRLTTHRRQGALHYWEMV